MKYILESYIEPVGYEGLPCAYYDRKRNRTVFLDKERFFLLLQCDGTDEIDREDLSEVQKAFLDSMIESGIVREAKDGEERKVFREYRTFPTRYRETAPWSVTGGCNYRCKHCFMSASDFTFGHISTEKCLEICRQLGECGIRSVFITGGEPLIREDLLQIIDGLLENGVRPTGILTNGGLVTETFLDELIRRDVRPGFQFSYDGVGWHDWLRGVDGAEEKLLQAFTMLRARGLRFSCAMMLHRHNVHTIRETVLKVAEYGGESLKVNVASPDGEWKKQTENALTVEEGYQAYLDYLPQYIEDGMPISITLDGAFSNDGRDGAYSIFDKGENGFYESACVCRTMRRSVYISPTGDVYPCQTMIDTENQVFQNLFDTPLSDILLASYYNTFATCSVREFSEHNNKCANCEYFMRCRGGCRAKGYTQNRSDYYHEDENACLYFRNGWAEKFRPYIEKINHN